MNKYKELLRFIPLLEDKTTKWKIENNDACYTQYTEECYELMNTISELTEGPNNSYTVLEKYGLSINPLRDEKFSYDTCNDELAFAVLAVMVRKERFVSGTIYSCINKGIVLRLLRIIEKYNEEKKVK